MNQKFFTFFVMAAMAAAMLTGCDKDPKPEDEQTDPVQLVSKITYEDGRYDALEYDDKNRLTKHVSYSEDGALDRTVTINYDSDGEVVSMKYDDFTEFYNKTDNRIDVCKDEDGDGKCDDPENILYLEVFHIEVNAQNEIVKDVYEYSDGSPTIIGSSTNTYTHTNGNVTKWTYSYVEEGTPTSGDVIVFTYDDKKSPFHDCASPSWFIWHQLDGCKNNKRTEITTSRNGDVVEDTEYTYTYDEAGYALTCEYVGYGSSYKRTETYEYIKR